MLIKLNEIKQIIKEELYYYLLEVKIGDLKKKYPDQSQLIDQLSQSIPNKFLEWSLLNYKEGMDLSQLSQQLQQLEQNIKRGKIKDDVIPKDIGQWKAKGVTLDTIAKVNQEASQIKTGREEKKEQKMEGSKTWYDDDHYLIVEPKTTEASCYYGRGTKWCISAKEDNYFKNYSSKGFEFLFVIDKQKKQNDPLYKVALVLKDNEIYEFYDAEDKKIYENDGKSNIFLNKLYGDFSNKILKIIKEMKIESEKLYNNPSFIRKYGISENIKEVKLYFDNLEKVNNAKYDEELGWIIRENLILKFKKIKRLPKIYKVGNIFDCSNNQLTTLEGSPQIIGGSFYCYNNQLTSLKGGPRIVNDNFKCYNNQLRSLEGAPQKIGGDFDYRNNPNLKDKTLPSYVKVGWEVYF